ncbi:MAG: CvpA family protein [Candidatus Omnitrophica bacterium]|nr:CvpA family protein [Candidatus Omnitrophota bacterium]
MIDIVFLFLILFFTLSGLQKGFLSYFLEFLLVFVCFGGSWLYYKETYNFLYSLIILFLAPLVIVVIFKFLLHISLSRTQNVKRILLSHLNNIAGGIIGFFWGIIWIVLISVVINIIPLENDNFIKLKDNVRYSHVLSFVKAAVPFKAVFLLDKLNNLSVIMNNPQATKTLRYNPEFQKLMAEERIQDFIRDRVVMMQLKSKQILGLLANPKFIAILEKPELLKKFMDIDFEGVVEFSKQEKIKTP